MVGRPGRSAPQQSKWIALAARQLLAHPVRFHQVWSVRTGTHPLFVWEPVPPNDQYVSLGMVAANSRLVMGPGHAPDQVLRLPRT